MFLRLNDHLMRNSLHESLQSAYKAFHRTETALIRAQNDIVLSVDSGQNVILVLLDMSAAFDTVDHEILRTRLHQHFGISDTALDWFRDYLHDCMQFVNIEHSQSNQRDLLIGVPQDSVLGPVLYLAYTIPISEVIK